MPGRRAASLSAYTEARGRAAAMSGEFRVEVRRLVRARGVGPTISIPPDDVAVSQVACSGSLALSPPRTSGLGIPDRRVDDVLHEGVAPWRGEVVVAELRRLADKSPVRAVRVPVQSRQRVHGPIAVQLDENAIRAGVLLGAEYDGERPHVARSVRHRLRERLIVLEQPLLVSFVLAHLDRVAELLDESHFNRLPMVRGSLWSAAPFRGRSPGWLSKRGSWRGRLEASLVVGTPVLGLGLSRTCRGALPAGGAPRRCSRGRRRRTAPGAERKSSGTDALRPLVSLVAGSSVPGLGPSQDVEPTLEAIGASPVVVARDLRVSRFDEVALQPAVRDDSADHGLEAGLLDVDGRGERAVS